MLAALLYRRFYRGTATGAEGETDNDCYSSFGNVVCDRWVMRAYTAAHDVAMLLRSSGIDAHTYLCRAPLDRIIVHTLNDERTQTGETRDSSFLNNAHILYRKCLFIVRNKYSARTYRSKWNLHALPPPVLSCALVKAYHKNCIVAVIPSHTHLSVCSVLLTLRTSPRATPPLPPIPFPSRL